MFLEDTPIEEYKIGSETIYVKREDLYGQDPMPPLAKLRGIRIVLDNLYKKGVRTVGVLDTRVSKSGWGVAAVRKFEHPDMKLMLGFPFTKQYNTMPPQHIKAQELGAEVIPQQGTRQSIMYYRFKSFVEENNGVMLPHGLPFAETALSVSQQSAVIPKELIQGTIVMIVGTGTILSGVLLGLIEEKDINIVGISAGKNPQGQLKNINRILNIALPFQCKTLGNLKLLNPIMEYDEECTCPCPFPSHPNYDRKAWFWLTEHINELKRPVLFWNIGA